MRNPQTMAINLNLCAKTVGQGAKNKGAQSDGQSLPKGKAMPLDWAS